MNKAGGQSVTKQFRLLKLSVNPLGAVDLRLRTNWDDDGAASGPLLYIAEQSVLMAPNFGALQVDKIEMPVS